jgi:hypothetical protein
MSTFDEMYHLHVRLGLESVVSVAERVFIWNLKRDPYNFLGALNAFW